MVFHNIFSSCPSLYMMHISFSSFLQSASINHLGLTWKTICISVGKFGFSTSAAKFVLTEYASLPWLSTLGQRQQTRNAMFWKSILYLHHKIASHIIIITWLWSFCVYELQKRSIDPSLNLKEEVKCIKKWVSWVKSAENEPANEIGVKLEAMMYKQSEQLVHNQNANLIWYRWCSN